MTEIFKLFGKIAIENDEANEAIDETTGKAGNSETKMTESFKKIGTAVATYFAVDKIVDFGKQVVDAAATVSAEASAFEQIMGSYSDTATEKMNQIADNTGMVATRLTPYMTSMTAKFKGLGYDIDEATDLASDGLNLAADAAAFWDMSLDDSMSHLNSFINGSYEGGEAIGLFANDTQMAQYAIQQGLVESTSAWSSLDEATKQATRLEYAQSMMEASGAVGQAAKESDQYANVQANLTEKWRQFKAQIGEPLLQNVVNPAMQVLSSLVDKLSIGFEALNNFAQQHSDLMIVIASVIGSVVAAITTYNIVQGVKVAMDAAEVTSLSALIAAKWADVAATAAALAPYLAIAAAIAAVVAIVVICIKHWDEIKEAAANAWEKIKEAWGAAGDWVNEKIKQPIVDKFNAIKESISNAWENIKTKFSDAIENIKTKVKTGFDTVKNSILTPINAAKDTVVSVFTTIKNTISNSINTARDTVKSAIDKIKSLFNFSWSLPKLKMPHITIEGEFSLDPLSVPSFGIEWYAKGGILNDAAAFGINPASNSLMVGGEAGPEAVAPIDTLQGYVKAAVAEQNNRLNNTMDKLIAMLGEYLPGIADSADKQVVLSTGEVVGALTPYIDTELGNITRLRERGC